MLQENPLSLALPSHQSHIQSRFPSVNIISEIQKDDHIKPFPQQQINEMILATSETWTKSQRTQGLSTPQHLLPSIDRHEEDHKSKPDKTQRAKSKEKINPYSPPTSNFKEENAEQQNSSITHLTSTRSPLH